jgi:hypothetical protein
MVSGETIILVHILAIMKHFILGVVPPIINTTFKLYEPIKNACLDAMCFGRISEG